ncbi:glycosyltransferase family 2 protein [Leuconostoc lactis]|uniref:glycosyltransferase family 2 protein n=1 Tax=Leuconostoc lactis TaxID=1246 RepID=UPI0028B19C7D|nr:glycosyltransferase [Leuconostoc lactis]
MNNTVPFFSVIVPMYNSEKYISETLKSIIDQSFTDWELILVDDGSTDDSLKMACDTCQDDSRVHFVSKKNGGLSDARNFGIDKVKGNYILFVDSDDILNTDLFEILRENILNNNKPDVVVFDYLEFDDKTNQSISKTDFVNKSNRYGEVAWNKAYKASFFRSNNFSFNKGIRYEDTAISHVIMALAETVIKISFVGYFYRRERAGSITSVSLLNDIHNKMVALDVFEENITKYTPKKKNSSYWQMRYFLSLAWTHLFLDYYLLSDTNDTYKVIVNKLKSKYIRIGMFKSRQIRDTIIYVFILLCLRSRFRIPLSMLSKKRSH